MDYLALIIGLVAGVVIGFLIAKTTRKASASADGPTDDPEVREQLIRTEKENELLLERIRNAEEIFRQQKQELNDKHQELQGLSSELATWKANHENLERKLTDQRKELTELQEHFRKEFENIANRILESNSDRIAARSKEQLASVLDPFNKQIVEFSKTVQDTYVKGHGERSSMLNEIKNLTKLNEQMRLDAQNLTQALKGDSKAQGNWGEFILEKILESSGLTEGQEYETQHHTVSEDGRRLHPDIVVHLPEGKHIIIDSKVSLTAYESYVSADDEESKTAAIRNHLTSVKAHIKGLSEKNYQNAPGMRAPDFVLLFMPIESSFSLAIREDQDLYAYGWERKIIVVSPSTLLATLRTIASVWKQEKQNRNAQEIARQAGDLYDKFVGFINDMENIEKSLVKAKETYDTAFGKLTTGRGNLIRRTEKLKELGVKTNKEIPEHLKDEDDLS